MISEFELRIEVQVYAWKIRGSKFSLRAGLALANAGEDVVIDQLLRSIGRRGKLQAGPVDVAALARGHDLVVVFQRSDDPAFQGGLVPVGRQRQEQNRPLPDGVRVFDQGPDFADIEQQCGLAGD